MPKTVSPELALRGAKDEYTGPPPVVFTSEEWYQRDLQACFRPRWLVAGHVDELADDPHAFLTFSLGLEEAMIRRGTDGRLRAYRNYCTHRGTRLCEGRLGVAKGQRIVCPYHTWTFSVDDGALLNANRMHEDFDRAPYGLRQVHVEEWNGLIFVCLDDVAPAPPSQFLSGIDLAGRDFGRMKLAFTKTHEVEANWKIVVENNCECYHCLANHPELCAVYDWQSLYTTEDEFVDYCADRAAGGQEVWSMPVRSYHTIDGRAVVSVPTPFTTGDALDDEEGGYVGWEPGVALNVARDMFWLFVPKPTGPRTTELRQLWLVNEEAVEGRDYLLEELTEFWEVTMQQDRRLCEAVQRGMTEPTYAPGPFNRRHQRGQAGFYRWYATQVMQRCGGVDPHLA